MNDSKIGTWLMRDGGTAVVLAVNKPTNISRMFGAYCFHKAWYPGSWIESGKYISEDSEDEDCDLIRKVSDSTELREWKPEKRWRPWTVFELKERLVDGLLVVDHKLSGFRGYVIAFDGSRVHIPQCGNYSLGELLEMFRQHDGTPCGVEVEE